MESSTTAQPADKPREYRVGTLVYTRGTLLQVAFWMLWGDFFFQLFESLTTFTPLLLRWNGASDTLIGLIGGSLSSVVAFFWYPVVATYSDRHRSKLGRRRPFLLWAIPPVVLSVVLLGAVKPAGIWLHRFLSLFGGDWFTVAGCSIAWVAACVVLFLIFNAFVVQAYACLIVDVIPVEVMGKFGGLYRAIGALGSLAFNRWATGSVESHTIHVYTLVGLLFASAFYLIVWHVKEGDYPPPLPKAPGGRLGAIKEYLQTSFRHRFYLNFFCVTLFNWSSLVPLNFVLFFGTQAGKAGYAPTLGLSLQTFGEVKGWTYLVTIPVFFIVGTITDYIHPMLVGILGLILTAVTYFCCYFFIHDSDSLLLWWSINQVAISVYLGSTPAMGPRLLPRDRYGQFVSANLIFGMVGMIFMPPIIGALLEWLRDYRYVWVFCGILNVLAAAALITLRWQWHRLGGDQSFTPPGPVPKPAG